MFLLLATLGACSLDLREPLKVQGLSGVVNLRSYDFDSGVAVEPTGWGWDAGVLWVPGREGRPESLLPAVFLGGPETGGTLVQNLVRPYRPGERGGLTSATAWVTLLVPPGKALALQIGSFPGAQSVWVNGILVLSRGVVSTEPDRYRADGFGSFVTVQPQEGRLEIVAQLVSDDPLVLHPELGRRWYVAATELQLKASSQEELLRALQVAVLGVTLLGFFFVGFLKRQVGSLIPFGAFLLMCMLKAVFNVEQAQPLLYFLTVPSGSRVYLFLNHGLNFLPFPLFVWFLHKQFPLEISRWFLGVLAVLTAIFEIWELFPLVALANGFDTPYRAVLAGAWQFSLNLFTVVTVLVLFERLYAVFRTGKPVARSLFVGGALLGLLTLFPVVLSVFLEVRFSYFLSWGVFLFLLVVTTDLIRLEIRSSEQQQRLLQIRIGELAVLGHFVPPNLAQRFGHSRTEDLRAGDRRLSEGIFLELDCAASPELWLPVIQDIVTKRQGIHVRRQGNVTTWLTDARSENALELALELRQCFQALGFEYRQVLVRGVVELRILPGVLWLTSVEPLPLERLAQLHRRARDCGATLVLDAGLKDGLVVGGWRDHRLISDSSSEIELFELETGPQVRLKRETLSLFEDAMILAALQKFTAAQEILLEVLRRNPLDTAAKYFLAYWSR